MTTSILLAGATGHLGQALGQVLAASGYRVRALVRRDEQRGIVASWADEIVVAKATAPTELDGVADGIDLVLSAIGITVQNDGASYAEVDYGANRNLLDAARDAGVEQFAYVASFGGDRLRHLPMTAAKEQFVDELAQAPIRSIVLRPNALFHDFAALLEQALSGTIALVGDGETRLNPISERDAAQRIVTALTGQDREVPFGGPETWRWRDIAAVCSAMLEHSARLAPLDPAKVAATIDLLPKLTPESVHGPLTFHLTMMGQDNLAPHWGTDRLEDWLAATASAMREAQDAETAA